MNKIITSLMLMMPMVVKAQSADDWGINDLTSTNLGTRELRDTIGGVINIILGFLGIVTTIAILYGGFKMMTSGGNSEKSGEGQKVVIAGAVGLIIVLAAYAISRFVLGSLYNETV